MNLDDVAAVVESFQVFVAIASPDTASAQMFRIRLSPEYASVHIVVFFLQIAHEKFERVYLVVEFYDLSFQKFHFATEAGCFWILEERGVQHNTNSAYDQSCKQITHCAEEIVTYTVTDLLEIERAGVEFVLKAWHLVARM